MWCATFKKENPWKLLRYVKPRPQQSVDDLQVEGKLIQDDEEKARILSSIFFPRLLQATLRFHDDTDETWNTTRPPGIFGEI